MMRKGIHTLVLPRLLPVFRNLIGEVVWFVLPLPPQSFPKGWKNISIRPKPELGPPLWGNCMTLVLVLRCLLGWLVNSTANMVRGCGFVVVIVVVLLTSRGIK